MINILFYFLCIFFLLLFQIQVWLVSINFRANLDLRMQEMAFPCFKFQNFLGSTPPDPLIHAWYIGHTRGLQPLLQTLGTRLPLLSPSDILSHRKVPFQKMPPPPTGKSLKKAQPRVRPFYSMLGMLCHNRRPTRVGNLAFLRPNNSILAFLFLVWP